LSRIQLNKNLLRHIHFIKYLFSSSSSSVTNSKLSWTVNVDCLDIHISVRKTNGSLLSILFCYIYMYIVLMISSDESPTYDNLWRVHSYIYMTDENKKQSYLIEIFSTLFLYNKTVILSMITIMNNIYIKGE